MRRKKKKKTYNPIKIVKSIARSIFMNTPTGTKVHKDKKKYSRKIKHKKRYDDDM